MNTKLLALATAIGLSMVACGGGGGSSPIVSTSPTPSTYTPTPVPSSGSNVRVQITPGSNVCNYTNASCVTVTVCQPGTSICDTVPNVLLDTGSFGLRIFGSLLPNTNNSLTPVTSSSGLNVSECVSYADGTGNWGPIKMANVTLNTTTTTSAIPIQIIDANATGVQNCPSTSTVTTPTAFGLNGILGVGPLKTDQGFGNYYTCSGSSCSRISTPPSFVTNPITQFSSGNNNGLTLTFAAVPANGAINADGYGIFGVGTSSSNTPGAGTSVFQISGSNLTVNSSLNGTVYPSFLDTGSQGLFFSTSFLPDCGGANAGFFCPTSNTAQTATMTGTNGLDTTTSAIINFNIGNTNDLLASGNTAFSNVGAVIPRLGAIDWGLPFYLGRTVYMVFADNTATINGVKFPASSKGYWIY